ncbi:UNVERIFIED_CONTAM: hypothetical protein PYX00_002423 [Menopon gallinae]|uniref:Uncharacterized protein n=1 Tax=Menopon gallinae TaxID=328185 RepID=A0AAW2IGZ2_9NEOP
MIKEDHVIIGAGEEEDPFSRHRSNRFESPVPHHLLPDTGLGHKSLALAIRSQATLGKLTRTLRSFGKRYSSIRQSHPGQEWEETKFRCYIKTISYIRYEAFTCSLGSNVLENSFRNDQNRILLSLTTNELTLNDGRLKRTATESSRFYRIVFLAHGVNKRRKRKKMPRENFHSGGENLFRSLKNECEGTRGRVLSQSGRKGFPETSNYSQLRGLCIILAIWERESKVPGDIRQSSGTDRQREAEEIWRENWKHGRKNEASSWRDINKRFLDNNERSCFKSR